MINFDYYCNGCGDRTTSQEMESFVCDCGGNFKLIQDIAITGGSSNFEPHYSPEVKQMVYSWKDAERKGKQFRSSDHPNGFILTQSNRRFINECKKIKANREDFIQETYAQGPMKKDSRGVWSKSTGIKYKPGKKVRIDDKTNSFTPVTSK